MAIFHSSSLPYTKWMISNRTIWKHLFPVQNRPLACFRFCVFLSLCPSPVHSLSLSLSLSLSPYISKLNIKKGIRVR
uniref:Uncharacterized protein n=1 Tax=Suricata suricatta TaxID=37032 RepID=A0A673US96_SURSU